MKKKIAGLRNKRGSIIADYTAAIVVFILFLIWPFVDYCTIGLRYMLFRDIVHTATQTASKATTFSAGSGNNAVMDKVPQAIAWATSQYTGIRIVSQQIRVVQTSLTGTTTYGNWGSVWPSTPDSKANVYTIEVQCVADLDPLLAFTGPFGNPIPGMTGPMRVSLAQQLMSETPNGMNQ
jgi:hypothetical protein